DPFLHQAAMTRIERLADAGLYHLVDARLRELRDELSFHEHRKDLPVDVQHRLRAEHPALTDSPIAREGRNHRRESRVHIRWRFLHTSTSKPRSTSQAAWPPRMPQFSRACSRSTILTWFLGIPKGPRLATIA